MFCKEKQIIRVRKYFYQNQKNLRVTFTTPGLAESRSELFILIFCNGLASLRASNHFLTERELMEMLVTEATCCANNGGVPADVVC